VLRYRIAYDQLKFLQGEQYGKVNMPDPEKPPTGIARSRRNLIKAGVIGASAILADLSKMKPAAANCGHNGKDVGEGCEGQCFLKGTMIRTADGNRKIEDLAVGDLLPSVFGGLCPIQWIGYYPYKKSDQARPWVKDVLPVRVARSALGPDVPNADLLVTKAHALLIDGVLVPAGDLINGTTITFYDARELDELEFFHIKLERHNVIYADGAPCETVMNVDENAVNFAGYLRHYGPATTQEAPCAPLLSFNGGRKRNKVAFPQCDLTLD
jgi:Hint domain